MLKQKIESRRMAENVAMQLRDDLMAELSCYAGYEVDYEPSDGGAKLTVHSATDTSCLILTSSCVKNVFDVIQVYEGLYGYNINYHLDILEVPVMGGKKVMPSIEISVTYVRK